MADLDSQQLQQQVDDLERKLRVLGATTDKNLTANQRAALKLDAVGSAASGAAAGLKQFTSQIYSGVQGAQVFSKAFKTATGAAGNAAKSFERDIGRNSKLSLALSALGGGLATLGDLAANMSDKLFDSFQSLSRVGAAGADGMSGVFDQLQNFRLGLEDLGKLTELFGQNAQSLVLFGGSVEKGAKSVGDLRKFVTGSGLEKEFMGLGMNTQEINEAMLGFVAQQSRLGLRQVTDYAKVASSLDAYIAEQDKITKLTGATRKQQEDAAMKALATEQFRAKIEALEAEGTEASRAEAQRLMSINAVLSASNEDLAAAFRATASGFVTSGPGVTGQLVAQGKILEVVNNKNMQAAEAAASIKGGVDQFMSGVGRTQMAVGGFEKTFSANGAALIDGSKKLGAFADGSKTAEQAQAEMRARTDEGVKAQVDLRTAQMDTMQNLQSLVNIGVVPATQALAIFAQQVHKTSRILPGGEPMGGGPMDSSVGAGAAAGATSADVLPGQGNPAIGMPGGIPGGLGIQQKAIGAALGAASSLLRQLGVGGQGINPDDVINFSTTGSGSRQHFDKLQPQVRERALAMAHAYKEATKKKLNLNSAFRSAEEQAALAASGGQGANPIAEPGQSLHQEGRALDFNSAEIDALERMGLLQKYGFNRGYAGGPHISMQAGGIASGPKSGYNAMLHGTEAVVPLPDGKTIPVTMPGMESSMASLAGSTGQGAELQEEMSRQSGLIMNQISRLDELVALMRNANGISHKILQASTN